MDIRFTLKTSTIQSYLDHFNEVNGTNLVVEILTPDQIEKVTKAFAELAVGEIEMRTDDHSGFETNQYFGKLV